MIQPTNTELARARALLSRRAPDAPPWVAPAIARQHARRRTKAERQRAARERQDALDQLKRCPHCTRPAATRSTHGNVCRCGASERA